MQTASINGQTIHYRLDGASHLPLLACCHAQGTDLRIWDPLLPYLTNHFRILRYDLRGHGLSSVPLGEHRLTDHVDDLAALLALLDLGPAHLCGVSFGGLIAQAAATRYPDRVRSLVLCNTAAQIGSPAFWQAQIDSPASAEAHMEGWFGRGFLCAHPDKLPLWRTLIRATSANGYAGACAALRDLNLDTGQAQPEQPVLCIVGADDTITPADNSRRYAAELSNARLESLADVGLLPSVEQPERLAQLIRCFVAKLEPAEARYELGMKVRRSVLGDAHVDRAEANKGRFDEHFQSYITESAWGSVWSRPNLSKRDRSLITIALLATLGHEDELAMHIRATANTGATLDEVRETLLHLGVYAGVPASNVAIRIAKEAYTSMGITID
ncbi:4-carboxymuconolactone decarboxylase [Marinobacter sp.]|uniref:4-carboxymuconolactone decarboxylase n=1 Tax=Marinobacter sp. TaxID=50741 RepID=UPI0035C756F7